MISQEQKTRIFELMNGFAIPEECPPEEARLVKNEFTEESYCQNLLDRAYDAADRLRDRLSVPEDEDVQAVIDAMEELSRYLSLKMFDYGEIFAKNQEQSLN